MLPEPTVDRRSFPYSTSIAMYRLRTICEISLHLQRTLKKAKLNANPAWLSHMDCPSELTALVQLCRRGTELQSVPGHMQIALVCVAHLELGSCAFTYPECLFAATFK